MQIQLNFCSSQYFQGHGTKNINQIMEKLYKSAYQNEIYEHTPDVFQVSVTMKDGKNVTALACFDRGVYTGLSFPYEMAHYRKEFSKKIIEQYNKAITKGKYFK